MDDLITISSALLTPLIAIIAAYIAYQQMLTNKNKFKHELFDRRIEIYEVYEEFIKAVVSKGYADKKDEQKLFSIKSQIPFLFNSNVLDYHQELFEKGVKLRSLKKKLSDHTISKGDKRTKLTDKYSKLNVWFEEQLLDSSSRFIKELKIDV